MSDVTSLLASLRAYREAVARHVQIVHSEMDALDPRANALFDSFDGMAAEDFHERWVRSRSGFAEYVDQHSALLRLIDDKIGNLADLDRVTGEG